MSEIEWLEYFEVVLPLNQEKTASITEAQTKNSQNWGDEEN